MSNGIIHLFHDYGHGTPIVTNVMMNVIINVMINVIFYHEIRGVSSVYPITGKKEGNEKIGMTCIKSRSRSS